MKWQPLDILIKDGDMIMIGGKGCHRGKCQRDHEPPFSKHPGQLAVSRIIDVPLPWTDKIEGIFLFRAHGSCSQSMVLLLASPGYR